MRRASELHGIAWDVGQVAEWLSEPGLRWRRKSDTDHERLAGVLDSAVRMLTDAAAELRRLADAGTG